MSKPPQYNTKEFKQLQDKWYKKLEDKGFKDIEYNEDTLNRWAVEFARARYTDVKLQSTAEYYRLAEHFLNGYKFKNAKDKLIWKLHSDGVSVMTRTPGDISIEREVRKRWKISRDYIQKLIKTLSEIMINEYVNRINE